MKNGAIALLAVGLLISGAFAFSQYAQNSRLSDQLMEMGVKLDYNALEAQYASEQFADIEANLAAIREKEGYVMANLNLSEFDGVSGPDDRIRREIAAIEMLIAENNKLIEGLKEEIGTKDSRLKNYRSSVASLEKRISDYKLKTNELVKQAEALKADLASSQSENKFMTQELVQKEFMVAAQSQQINQQEEQLRTAYYAVGPFKELKESEVVEKEGGILGIAATKTIKTDFNRERFTQVDIYDNTTIPVFSKNAELISNHDSKSYKFVEGDDETRWVEITDPEKFWENTKYLVIVTKGGQNHETAFAK